MPKRYWLVEYRANKKLTQAECARLCGIGRGHYCSIENGKTVPMVDTAYKISKFLEFDFNEWFKKEGVKQ